MPNIDPLVHDEAMKRILARRWAETRTCIDHGAYLAATVMMGGLLEAILLARLHSMPDKSTAFGATTCPKDKKTGKALPLQKWTLVDYIEVGHELGWITRAARDVSSVMRDYRNFIHPYKELSQGVALDGSDSELMWSVFNQLVGQVVTSLES